MRLVLYLVDNIPHDLLEVDDSVVLLLQPLLHRVLHPVDPYPPLTVLSARICWFVRTEKGKPKLFFSPKD